MHNLISLPLWLAILLAGCTGAAEPGSTSGRKKPQTPDSYKGPSMATKIVGDELQVTVTVSSSGHRLELTETSRDGDHTSVKLRLTAPGVTEAVTAALEDKSIKVALKAEPGPVHVFLQQVQRDVEYFVEPEFVLAKIVPR